MIPLKTSRIAAAVVSYRPSEYLPDQVLRFRFGAVVGVGLTARRMQEYGHAPFGERLEHRTELRRIEGPSIHVAVNLYGAEAKLTRSALDFATCAIRIVHRHCGNRAGETLRVFGHQLRELVVRNGGEFHSGVRCNVLRWRPCETDDLTISVELVHHPEARLEVGQPLVVRRLSAGAHKLQVRRAARGELL